jgi:hypothetical protein
MANHRRVQPEQEAEIRKLHADGHCAAFIARSLGIPVKTMYPTMRRMGLEVTRHGRRKGITSDQLHEMAILYLGGESTQEIASRYGIEASIVGTYLRAQGVDLRPAGFQSGDQHHNWKGGRIETEDYVFVLLQPEDPFYEMGQLKNGEGAGKYVLEHRYVMAKKLGRPLFEYETVHHKDLNGKNNDPGNLELRIGKHGKGAMFQCIDCGSFNIEALTLGAPL